jgi:hypothetical protein
MNVSLLHCELENWLRIFCICVAWCLSSFVSSRTVKHAVSVRELIMYLSHGYFHALRVWELLMHAFVTWFRSSFVSSRIVYVFVVTWLLSSSISLENCLCICYMISFMLCEFGELFVHLWHDYFQALWVWRIVYEFVTPALWVVIELIAYLLHDFFMLCEFGELSVHL